MKKEQFSIWLALWVPLIFLLMQLLGEIFLPQDIMVSMHSENGFHEIAQFIVMSAAFIIAGYGAVSTFILGRIGIALWLCLAALGSLYVAGEEISWGQHFAGWESEDFWLQINDQGETNLHNTSSWLDQKPRLVLEIGVMFGGIIIPLLNKANKDLLPRAFRAIYPPLYLLPLAAMTAAIKISEKILEMSDISFYTRASEVIELFIFYYVLLYVLGLVRRHAFSRT